ncbi:hypothetical protein Q7P37_011300 [Cladosporium fusiforme]
MQLSAHPHRRAAALAFLDHTPREFEITAPVSSSRPSDTFADPADMGMGIAALGAGPLYTNAIMGQTPSAQQREQVRKASSTILREDSIKVECSDDAHAPFGEQESRPDSLHYSRMDQLPYARSTDKIMTPKSRLSLRKEFASHDLAFFLKTTGPNPPSRRPRKVEDHPRRAVSASKNVLKWLKVGQRRPSASVTEAHRQLNNALEANEMQLQDEGGLLLPPSIEQKISSTGKKYLALKPQEADEEERVEEEQPISSTHILESRVSVSLTDDTYYSNGFDAWHSTRFPPNSSPLSRQPSAALGAESEAAIRLICQSSSPIRPVASDPPTPQPESATSIAETYQVDLTEHPAKRSLVASRSLSGQLGSLSGAPISPIALPQEEFPVKLPRHGRDVEIKHPSPRRLGSHPVLLHRTPSMAASIGTRSFSDSLGPPPPRSPLRLCRDPKSIEGLMSSPRDLRKATPKVAPSIKSVSEHASDVDTPIIIPSVITECSGPIKRPKSRDRNHIKHPLYPMSRKEREEHTRQRKIRDRPGFSRTIDAVVNAQPLPARRLRKARPQIQIPEVKPAPLATRASSSASSSASWKKVTENTLSPVSTVPSQDEKSIEEGKTGYSPNSLTASNSSPNSANMALSPVMLVAEEEASTRLGRVRLRYLVQNDEAAAAPTLLAPAHQKPPGREAKKTTLHLSPRHHQTALYHQHHPPPDTKSSSAPNPHPNARLQQTPNPKTSPSHHHQKPSLPLPSNPATNTNTNTITITTPSSTLTKPLPHITTQDLRTSSSSSSNATTTRRIDARLERLEHLEKQNALLNAALMAVLRTNGALNTSGPFAAGLGDALEGERGGPMAWENRVARRSTAAGRHAPSSSNGSASLDLYMSSRAGKGPEV